MHWIIALVVAIGIVYLFIMIELVKMHDRKILFYNIKTASLAQAGLAKDSSINEAILDNNSPLFVVYEDKIVFGTLQSLVLPKLKKDSLILNKQQLREDFKEKVASYKNSSLAFPAYVVGISFKNKYDYSSQLVIINQIFNLIKDENKKLKNLEISPSIVFVDTLPAS